MQALLWSRAGGLILEKGPGFPRPWNTCLKHSCHPVVTVRLAAPPELAEVTQLSKEKAPESYFQQMHPSLSLIPPSGTNTTTTSWAGQSETPRRSQCQIGPGKFLHQKPHGLGLALKILNSSCFLPVEVPYTT